MESTRAQRCCSTSRSARSTRWPGRACPARVHGAVPLGAGQRGDLGQPGHLAPGADRHRAPRPAAHAAPGDGDRRRAVGPDGRESELVAGQPFTDEHVVVVDDW